MREVGHCPSESCHASRKFTHFVHGNSQLDVREYKCIIELAGLGVVVCRFLELIGYEEDCESLSNLAAAQETNYPPCPRW
jgi:hypothetical protein